MLQLTMALGMSEWSPVANGRREKTMMSGPGPMTTLTHAAAKRSAKAVSEPRGSRCAATRARAIGPKRTAHIEPWRKTARKDAVLNWSSM